MNNSPESLSEMADAMNDISTLPHDPQFNEFIKAHRTTSVVIYEQNPDDEPFHVDTSLLRTVSADDIDGNRMMTIENLRLEANTDSVATTALGTATINQIDYLISYSSDESKLFLQERNFPDLPPSVELSEQQLTELLLLGIITPSSPDILLEDILASYDDPSDTTDRLSTLIYALGSISGTSSRTTTAFIETDGAIVGAKLTERESPSDSELDDTLSLFTPTELFTDTSHLVNERHTSPDDEQGQSLSEYALRGVSDTNTSTIYLDYLTGNSPLPDNLRRYESTGDVSSAREYGTACVQFLAAYRRARASSRE